MEYVSKIQIKRKLLLKKGFTLISSLANNLSNIKSNFIILSFPCSVFSNVYLWIDDFIKQNKKNIFK